MNKKNTDLPIAVFIFNRPDLAAETLEILRIVRPSTLFLVADGPRNSRENEACLCTRARAVFDEVDWPCRIERNFSDTNLGCRNRLSSGITWVFKHVDRAVILEDDCHPVIEFFDFAQHMLEKFENDSRVFAVTGTNFCGEWRHSEQDYHFSIYGGIWGWATWRRAWAYYDNSMKLFETPGARRAFWHQLRSPLQVLKRYYYCKKTYERRLDSWGYVWSFTRMINSGLTVVPAVNLVQNKGFRQDGTHTVARAASKHIAKTGGLSFPLRENPIIVADRSYDRKLFWQQSPLRIGPILRFIVGVLMTFLGRKSRRMN